MSMKNAAACGATATTRQQPRYRLPRRPVKHLRQIFPGRRDRAPARPPTPASTPRPAGPCHAAALGLLIILLSWQSQSLAPRQRARTWRYADGWVRQIVEVRRRQGAA